MVKFEKVRIIQFQYFSVSVIVIFISFLLFPVRRRMDTQTALVGMMHLGSWAAQYGAQLWVTLVAGLTMFYNLPRHMFGRVQTRLFPMFFLWSLVTSSIMLGTFVIQHPLESMQRSHVIQISMLIAGFVSAALNSLILAPLIVRAMLVTFQMEVEAGVGDVIGYADMKEMKKNPEYSAAYRTFRRCHGMSGLLTLVGLASNTVHLYYITSQCLPL
uniref:TMEM205-like domain-containing protein n=1 Tax=Haliotis diversicolor TaxID=36095 RepID=B3TK28_HALDV|nr:hypothetical protein [Haliotis diversicolor]